MFLQQFSFLKTDSLCNVILYRQCLFTAYGHSKLLFDLCSVIHFSFFQNSSALNSALFFFFLLIIITLQELLVKSHQLPLNKTKNERSLMAMQCKDLNNLVDSVFLCVHKDCSFVRTEDTDAIYTTLFLQNICCL